MHGQHPKQRVDSLQMWLSDFTDLSKRLIGYKYSTLHWYVHSGVQKMIPPICDEVPVGQSRPAVVSVLGVKIAAGF